MLTFKTAPPNPIEYHALFETTGWNASYEATPEQLARAHAASWYAVSAYEDGVLVGFGRLVSDGVLHAMVYDMIVRPDRQGMGVGSQILSKLLERCREAGIRDVQLFCAEGKKAFYLKNGFVERPGDAPGMQLAEKEPA